MCLIRAENLAKYYIEKSAPFLGEEKIIHALDAVSFSIEEGQTLGLVGESGCGKSTLARIIVRLENATKGKIYYKNRDITNWRGEKLKQLRKKIQIIFQNSRSSLDPRQTVGEIIMEPLKNYKINPDKQMAKVKEMVNIVGLNPQLLSRYPHEFSDGQCQRVNIARALILEPELLVCDEPISSLDVSLQAQILNLLNELKKIFNLSYLFISHDLHAVKYISDKMAVMYLGEIVEVFNIKYLNKRHHHPYTEILLKAIPIIDPLQKNQWYSISCNLDNEIIEKGCKFLPRCPYSKKICHLKKPTLKSIENEHFLACHLY
ncbi:ABC transporter ATP-binding protein [Tepidanaerobacter acetatoxydans]|uniref:ABC transporter ATP-binding protein n=1 Tax=Tepidanaerobacter acetatoxydans TaxID=499229 RepID=UPI001BD3007E|nr:ABC transporter ATP-binding protein [Tepidanaerobacter acetatoxydans]